jgi:hypothetical protein
MLSVHYGSISWFDNGRGLLVPACAGMTVFKLTMRVGFAFPQNKNGRAMRPFC